MRTTRGTLTSPEVSDNASYNSETMDHVSMANITVSKKTDDNFTPHWLQKRAFTQPVKPVIGPQLGVRKPSTGLAGPFKSPTRPLNRRSTLGPYDLTYDLTPEHLRNSSTSKEKPEVLDDFELRSAFNDMGLKRTSTQNDSAQYEEVSKDSLLEPFRTNADVDYPRTADRVPSVQPNVNYQDKLWTQIDVLDDVKKMAEEAMEMKTFFTPEHEASLQALNRSQLELLASVKKMEKKMVSGSNKKRAWFDFDIDLDKSLDLKDLYDGGLFETIKESVEESRAKLEDVARAMRNEEETEDSSNGEK